MSILVVGAGLSGAVLANKLSADSEVVVIDYSEIMAGNCYDYRDNNGIMVHKYGSHIFHTSDEDVWKYLLQFTLFNNYTHEVIGMVDGKEIPIPINFKSIQRLFPDNAKSIENKLLSFYGYGARISIMDLMKQDDEELKNIADYFYENIFLHYTEKQWGRTPYEIDGSVIARVPVVIGEDDRYFQDRFQGVPIEGYTKMIEKMLYSPNITVRLNLSFKDIDPSEYDKIFYTGPIDELMDYCYGPLPYRSVRFELEEYDMEHYQSNAVVNYPNEHEYTRIHEYKYYLNDKSDRTVIAKEYSEEFILGKNGRFYPIPTVKNIALYNRYLKLAKERYPNIYFLGRLGDYKYYDMDKAIARAFEVYREAMQ